MHEDTHREGYLEGKRVGLAFGALAGGIVAFISLLGIEKAILAMVLAALALRGAGSESRARRPALLAMGIAGVYMVTFVVLMILFREELGELARLLQQLG